MKFLTPLLFAILCFPTISAAQSDGGGLPPGTEDFDCDGSPLLLAPGKREHAIAYYCRITDVLKFQFKHSTLNSLLSHFGWVDLSTSGGTGLTADLLETIDSNVLMATDDAAFEILASQSADAAAFKALLTTADFQNDAILASRFFAPKIATYYYPDDPATPANETEIAIKPDDIIPGWRKLVRIKPRKGSQAEADGIIERAYILFNFKAPDLASDPYSQGESGNNQIIIVPKDLTSANKDRIFFGVYKKKSLGYPLGLFLGADFDLPGHVGVNTQGAPDSHYFVPTSCAACHGHGGNGEPVDPSTGISTGNYSKGVYPFAKPNYLDTDQWYDWMGYDFPTLQAGPFDVIFDGGKDKTTAKYKKAFDVIRRMNLDIEKTTHAAEEDTSDPSFQTLAVRKWLKLHDPSIPDPDDHKHFSLRSFGDELWDLNDPDQMELLSLLNNHCFRCHSSVLYNVFDKKAVRKKSFGISIYLVATVPDGSGGFLPGHLMPQGRVLSDADRKRIVKLIDDFFSSPF